MEIQATVVVDSKGRLSCTTALKCHYELLYNIDIEKQAHLLNLADKAIQLAIEEVNNQLLKEISE